MKQFDNFSKKTIENLKIYEATLKKWQNKINLISPTTVNDIWNRHILDSAQLYPFIKDTIIQMRKREQGELLTDERVSMPKSFKLLDMGSGAGFPGLVLAIIQQGQGDCFVQIHLVESDARKCVFLSQIAQLCHLDVVIHNQRIEALQQGYFDILTARALKDTDTLLNYLKPLANKNAVAFFLKGKTVDDEILKAKKKHLFQYEKIKSLTAQDAFILKITSFKNNDNKTEIKNEQQ